MEYVPPNLLKNLQRKHLFHSGELGFTQSIGNSDLLSGNVYWFAYARQALLHGMRFLKIKKGDKVLVPAYICNVIESPFKEMGVEIEYFDSNWDLTPDFNLIESKITKNTKALLWVNYFGFPAPFKQIKEFCDKHNLFFIEDNAHGFLSKYQGKWLGTIGDISITSIRKSLPIVNGAILRINNKAIFQKHSYQLEKLHHADSLIKYVRNYLLWYFKSKGMINKRSDRNSQDHVVYDFGNSLVQFPDPILDIRINSITLIIIKSLNYEIFYLNRRRSVERVNKFIKILEKYSFSSLFNNIPKGTIPLQIPLIWQEEEKRMKEVLRYFNRYGVEAFYWPDLPDCVVRNNQKYQIANRLRNKLLHFPI
ncbi:DegT/DnrJ/EryC1/StrS aminotransferase family protein [candidate division KSB1 bacterium]|nr:DegT/DnrJ/EryC1/StrS aminotransferase family protein [candidate division KSB1 bacterium]